MKHVFKLYAYKFSLSNRNKAEIPDGLNRLRSNHFSAFPKINSLCVIAFYFIYWKKLKESINSDNILCILCISYFSRFNLQWMWKKHAYYIYIYNPFFFLLCADRTELCISAEGKKFHPELETLKFVNKFPSCHFNGQFRKWSINYYLYCIL